MVNIKRFKSITECVEFLADQFLQSATKSISEKGFFRVGLSGGNSPKPFFSLMASKYIHALDWKMIEFYWIDERYVSTESYESNFGNAHRLWLNKVPAKLFPMVNTLIDQKNQVNRYDHLLDAKFGKNDGLDWVLMGVGADGHIASIFPNDSTGIETNHHVFLSYHPVTSQSRISMSMNFLLRSKHICNLITGEEKEVILDRLILGSDNKNIVLPVEYLLKHAQDHLILTDIKAKGNG